MISEAVYPKTKSDLVKALQRMPIDRIKIIEPYDKTRDQEIQTTLRELNYGTGDITVVILRSR